MKVTPFAIFALVGLWSFGDLSHPAHAEQNADGNAGRISVRSLQPEKPLRRARKPTRITAIVENTGPAVVVVTPSLLCPEGVTESPGFRQPVTIPAGGSTTSVSLGWNVKAAQAMQADLRLVLKSGEQMQTSATLSMVFLPPVNVRKASYVPKPKPVKTDILVGAINCPLWEPNDRTWDFIGKHPERMPALGVYDQSIPEVADWETKWAVEHGINFFLYCWYRASKSGTVEMKYASAIDAFMKSKYVDKFKFAIMWENQARNAAWGESGIFNEEDLFKNLMPFWMQNYFKHASYLKMDNKPLLFIYDAERLASQLGGVQNVPRVFGKMRQACKDEGFDGLYLLGECRGFNPQKLEHHRAMGFDYLFPYVWPVGEPWRAVDMQIEKMQLAQTHGVLPWVLTASQGWSGWNDKPEKYIYTLPPHDYEELLRRAKDIVTSRPANELASRIFLLDNWNEWGEGHYIAPYRQYGFGYLDAVRRVFSNAPEKHADLLPEDLGLGPYDSAKKMGKR